MTHVVEHPPVQTEEIDMSAFEQDMLTPEEQFDIAMMEADLAETAPLSAEDEAAMGGFDPALLSMYLAAAPGSEFSRNVERLMMAEFVTRNAVQFGIIEGAQEDEQLVAEEDDRRNKKAKKNAEKYSLVA